MATCTTMQPTVAAAGATPETYFQSCCRLLERAPAYRITLESDILIEMAKTGRQLEQDLAAARKECQDLRGRLVAADAVERERSHLKLTCGQLNRQLSNQAATIHRQDDHIAELRKDLGQARHELKHVEGERDKLAAELEDLDEHDQQGEESPLPPAFIDLLGQVSAHCFPAAEGDPDPLRRITEAWHYGVAPWRAALLCLADKLHPLQDRAAETRQALDRDLLGAAVMPVAALHLFREETRPQQASPPAPAP